MSKKNGAMLTGEAVTLRRLPVNFEAKHMPVFYHELERVIPPYCLRISGLSIHSTHFNNDRSCFERFVSLAKSLALLRVKFFLRQSTVQVFDRWSHGYFHWLLDLMPKLYLLDENKVTDVLILPEACRQYQETIQEIFNFRRICFIPNGHIILSGRVFTIMGGPSSGNYNELLVRDMSKKILEHYFIAKHPKPQRRVYISRRNALRRRVANEDQLLAVLHKYSFEIIEFEKYSFREQVSIASQAQIMIGPHGAGLSNMIFMEQGSSVLEFRIDNDFINNCYFSLACAFGLKYWYCMSWEKGNADTDGCLRIDPVALDNIIREIIARN